MKKLLGFSMVLSALLIGKAHGQQESGWSLTWSDEFSNTGAPDPTKWTIEVNGDPPNGESEYYTNSSNNVHVDSGYLYLTALQQNMGSKNYTSGRINTSAHFTQEYGRWEARIKLPAGAGFWPAFWILGDNINSVGWPDCGEADIMEYNGANVRTSTSAMHGPNYFGDTPIFHANTLAAGVPDLASAFHIYACEWSTDTVRFYVDSTCHYTVGRADIEKYGNWVFDHPFFTILNLAIGGNYTNDAQPPSSALPASMVVDYVRVYKAGPILAVLPRRSELATAGLPSAFDAMTGFDFNGRKLSISRLPSGPFFMHAYHEKAALFLSSP